MIGGQADPYIHFRIIQICTPKSVQAQICTIKIRIIYFRTFPNWQIVKKRNFLKKKLYRQIRVITAYQFFLFQRKLINELPDSRIYLLLSNLKKILRIWIVGIWKYPEIDYKKIPDFDYRFGNVRILIIKKFRILIVQIWACTDFGVQIWVIRKWMYGSACALNDVSLPFFFFMKFSILSLNGKTELLE